MVLNLVVDEVSLVSYRCWNLFLSAWMLSCADHLRLPQSALVSGAGF